MSGEKTEPPSPKRLRDARQKGQVAKSQEVSSALVVLAVAVAVGVGWNVALDCLKTLLVRSTGVFGLPFDLGLRIMLRESVLALLVLSLPVVFFAAVAGTVGHVLQTGFLFAIEPAKPSLEKLNPKQWFKKVFSMKNLMEFAKSALKVSVIGLVLWKVFRDATPTLVLMPYAELNVALGCLGTMTYEMMKWCGVTFVAIAVGDYFLQRHFFMKENMMSKDELKQEYKEMEGDPQIKGQRRHLHQEMAMSDQVAEVRRSNVLITNPTHIAIALRYRKGETPLPVIAARGEGALARRMMEVAEEEGIPIMRNVPLAHDLWEQGRVSEYIPSELIEPVAEVLRWVQEVTRGR